MAAQNDVFVGLSARKSHSAANAHLVLTGAGAGAGLLVNSDAHNEADLLTPTSAEAILRQAGLDCQRYRQILDDNPSLLIEKVDRSSLTTSQSILGD